ncbi:serine threonine- kinase Sgk2 [Venturia nashicola]|nr:serine threonine- kinase Sgk2 [Venturia nashicola]
MNAFSDADIIANNPIEDGLNEFRALLEAKYKDLDATNLTLELIIALRSIPLARVLKSRSGRGTLLTDLFNLGSQIDSDQFNVRSIIPLFESTDSYVSDIEICNALFVLFARPTTPLYSDLPFTASFQQTPWTFNTSSFADTSDLRRHVDPILKAEVEDNLIIDHLQFFETFFIQIPQLLEIATAVFKTYKDSEPPLYKDGAGWAKWPEGCEELRVLD